ncbi:MAG TPA: cbb3-type cytochrome c oxidase subunit I [Sandaracinaceae bacterium LLY-WYZ-13_1]|nr:cbb3-type cytochrome c oxidase subunit I [Sandaracinaceae bacterium LLY-WYZ-13_1]
MKKTEPDDVEPLPYTPSEEVREAQERRLQKVWAVPKGWRYLSAVNNETVGGWYTSAALCFLLFGGVLALLMRLQLAVPENDFLSAGTYDELFTMHGSVMMFLVAVPIFEAFSIMVLPEVLGSRELPFPRLSAYGFWCYLIGALFVCGSLFTDAAPRGGWFMYPPLTSETLEGYGPDVWLLGLSFIEIASIAAAVELLVGVLKVRPPGMRINLLPLYGWYLLVVAAMVLFAFPPLIAGDLLLEVARAFDWPFFDAARGGDPILWQHLFWIFGHPEVYIVFLPSIALVAMIVPTFAKTPMVGYGWVVLAALGTGFLSFGLWVHHMFTTGIPGISLGIFSAASEAIAIPTGVQIFCFIATMLAGKLEIRTPVLFILGGFSTFIIGGLTGVMVALVPFDLQAHDSYFVVGHLHSVLIGGTIFPIVGAIYYFMPLVNGKHLSERLGTVAFWLMFAGFNATFVPMHLTGLLGMPRRVFTYPTELGDTVAWLNLTSTIGAFVLAGGVAVFLFDLLRPKKNQPYAKRNPWGAGTLEWLPDIPEEVPWGVRSIPEIDSRYPLWDQPDFVKHVDEGRFYLADAEELERETLVTTPVDGKPIYCLRVGGPTFVTLIAAVFTGGFFILATFHLYVPAIVSAGLAIAAIVRWLWKGTGGIPAKDDKDVGLGLVLPTYVSGSKSVGWWGMLITMLADVTAFLSLVFGYFFYWTTNAEWPPPGAPDLGLLWPGVALALLLGAWLCTVAARSLNRADRGPLYHAALTVGALAAAGGAGAILWAPAAAGMDPTTHVYPAMVWMLAIWTALHAGLGVLMQLYCVARRAAGHMDATHGAEVVNVTLYWHFAAFTAFVTVAVTAGFPIAAG